MSEYTAESLKKLFDEKSVLVSHQMVNGESAFYTSVYMNMFNEYPRLININNEGFYLNPNVCDDLFIDDDDDDDDEYIEEDEDAIDIYKYENIDVQQTMINFYDYYKNHNAYVFRHDMYPIIVADHLIIYWNSYMHELNILTNDDNLDPTIANFIVDKKSNSDHRWVSYVTSTAQGFNETAMKVNNQNIDLDYNYNDDLPHEQITEFLKSNKSGLVLLHGNPGTGKTSYIRHLIYTLKGRRFIVLDNSVFNYITDASFVSLLLENKNAVVILEDCEAMLSDRLNGNTQLATLLNLSDGILGDSFNFKFICTFNANIAKLDKAILRKGRLKVKYEFKALTPEKTKALCNKIGKTCKDDESLTLAEIFNYEENNGVKEEKRIGFGK